MKVAMLIGSLSKGGTERILVNLTDYLLKNGHQVTVVTQYVRADEYLLNSSAKRLISDITPQETGKIRLLNFRRRFYKLRRIWKTEQPDVILSFIGKNNLMAILTARFLAVPVAVAVRGAPEAEYPSGLMRKAARLLYRYAAGIILQTEASRTFFPESLRPKAVILKNPMNPHFFRPGYAGERDKTVVAVGRVDENKNHRLLIEAFAGLAEEYPEYRVIIYGEGPLRETLTREVTERGLTGRVILPGRTDEPWEIIYRAGIYVLTSDTEGVPNTLIEAMLLGLPVIATDCPCGGPAELITHGRNGLLTPVGAVDKMRENLRYLLSDLQKAAAMGREAARIQELYDPDRTCQTWENYLKSLRPAGGD